MSLSSKFLHDVFHHIFRPINLYASGFCCLLGLGVQPFTSLYNRNMFTGPFIFIPATAVIIATELHADAGNGIRRVSFEGSRLHHNYFDFLSNRNSKIRSPDSDQIITRLQTDHLHLFLSA